ncbi:uncharacterized protein B0I36DRAFT_314762 [Microdochium trichocladiopsis]|uniref:Uncharacterized protein n=1 Tax=Microdochium trichocladiopsis TaxID=1682393 RepID=A0A9P8YGY8_9PEZI|nr:uncharacterized protein B0I36DRAFT_314762 [Microdochium trichocladiopsis]KAH7037763.1 hypothetical protein B0I36DRAFT_314762 [Microdochium trichocladiopsis]
MERDVPHVVSEMLQDRESPPSFAAVNTSHSIGWVSQLCHVVQALLGLGHGELSFIGSMTRGDLDVGSRILSLLVFRREPPRAPLSSSSTASFIRSGRAWGEHIYPLRSDDKRWRCPPAAFTRPPKIEEAAEIH